MRAGDLSANAAPAVGVRFENVLYNFGKVNTPGKAFVEDLLQKDVNIFLLTLMDERKVRAWCYKWNIPYTQVFQAESKFELIDIAIAHKLVVLYDTDERVLEMASARGKHQMATVRWEQTIDGLEQRPDNETNRRGQTERSK